MVKNIQVLNPKLVLAGSLALIHANIMDEREIADIDFVVNWKDFDSNTRGIHSLYSDNHYGFASYKEYESFHGRVDDHIVNILVFDDEVELEFKLMNDVLVQDIETILFYKTKYNRDKDRRDLENIANKCIEDIIGD